MDHIGVAEDELEVVAHEHDGTLLGTQLVDDIADLHRLPHAQRGSRLVHNDDRAVVQHCSGDGDVWRCPPDSSPTGMRTEGTRTFSCCNMRAAGRYIATRLVKNRSLVIGELGTCP